MPVFRRTHDCLLRRGSHTVLSMAIAFLIADVRSPGSDHSKSNRRSDCCAAANETAVDEWSCYGRDPGGARYSPLRLINRENVRELKVAWIYRTGDVSNEKTAETTQFEATPIMVWGTLYVPTPFNRVIALDPETGRRRWEYDPKIDLTVPYGDGLTCRGVAAWTNRDPSAVVNSDRRVFVATNDGRLIALDSDTGSPCTEFGDRGQIRLTQGVGNPRPGEYHVTSPPAIAGSLVIVGSAITDNERTDAPSGVVRAFDAKTGLLRWMWDPIPRTRKDPAWKSWRKGSASRTGAANVWSILSVDPDNDLLFLPTSSPSPDFYGGERPGDNLYSDSVVALRASTGKLIWSFQVVHHDIWDYDVPAQPALITVNRRGVELPAVAVATKMGYIFVLDRLTGKPLFPVQERPVPQSAVKGEALSHKQPFPVLPPPLVPQRLTPDDAWGITPEDRQWCREQISSLRSDGIFTPPSVRGSVVFPGNIGGAHWGGASFDPIRGTLVVNTNNFPFVVRLIPRPRYGDELKAHPQADLSPQTGTPYAMLREVLRTRSGVLCNAPPWGKLTAINLENGSIRWSVPLGSVPGLASLAGSAEWGSPNLGGSIITAGGLVFIAAAMDKYLRAFDIDSGVEIWKASLPASAQATPMTYRVNGKQYVVVAAGGHGRLGTELGDYLVAFALP
jgi:quinoprotein glucose dehydrogenase